MARKDSPQPKHVGGGWYELPDGSKVQGEEAAREAIERDLERVQHVGGGWYELPDGSKVQGEEVALRALGELKQRISQVGGGWYELPDGSKVQGEDAALAALREVEEAPSPTAYESPFGVGDKVVHPHHGAAVIVRKEKHTFDGESADYFVLEAATDQLTVRLPVHKTEEVGIRPVISKNATRKVFQIFNEEPQESGSNWSRWYKVLTEKITSGDIFQVAEVVRDLTYAQQTKGISPALKRMLSRARLTLTSELRFALDISEDEATKRLDRALPTVESEQG